MIRQLAQSQFVTPLSSGLAANQPRTRQSRRKMSAADHSVLSLRAVPRRALSPQKCPAWPSGRPAWIPLTVSVSASRRLQPLSGLRRCRLRRARPTRRRRRPGRLLRTPRAAARTRADILRVWPAHRSGPRSARSAAGASPAAAAATRRPRPASPAAANGRRRRWRAPAAPRGPRAPPLHRAAAVWCGDRPARAPNTAAAAAAERALGLVPERPALSSRQRSGWRFERASIVFLASGGTATARLSRVYGNGEISVSALPAFQKPECSAIYH